MMEYCDVAIVGLGPAGSNAAIAAARQGARVIAIDRKKVAGQPVQCAEFVPMMLGVESGPVGEALVQPIEAMESFVEGVHDRTNSDFRGKMVDRATFDRRLAEQAKASGADLRFGLQLDKIESDGTLRFAEGKAIRPKVLIGADGPRSRVGLAIGSTNSEMVETRQVTVPLLRPQSSTDIYLSSRIPGGYGWLFPKRGVANVGLGLARRWRSRLKPELDALCGMLVDEGIIGRERLAHTGGAIPVGGPLPGTGKLGSVPVLLAGDAAGLANPVTGAGIPAACHSGRMTGEAAARLVNGDAEAIDDYCEELDDFFGGSLRRALSRRRVLLQTYEAEATGADDLRRGWIAYPAYWSHQTMKSGEKCDELLEA